MLLPIRKLSLIAVTGMAFGFPLGASPFADHDDPRVRNVSWGNDALQPVPTPPLLADFTDYPPKKYHSGPATFPDFETQYDWAREFQSRIVSGIESGVNFAGSYRIIEIGCGTYCRLVFIADMETGSLFRFPYGGEDQYQLSLDYSPDSRLIRASWKNTASGHDTLKTDECIAQNLIWAGAEFDIQKETRFKIKQGEFCRND